MNRPKFKIGDIVAFYKPTDSSLVTGEICAIHGQAGPSEPFHYHYVINGDDSSNYSIDEHNIAYCCDDYLRYYINDVVAIEAARKAILNSVYGANGEYEVRSPSRVLTKYLIDRVIFHDPATIIYWKDGTKTVVKCKEGEKFDKMTGFAMALLKHECGKDFHTMLKEWTSDENPRVIDRTVVTPENIVLNDELDIPMQAINDETSNHDVYIAYKMYKCPKCEKKFEKYQARLTDYRCTYYRCPYCKQKLKI